MWHTAYVDMKLLTPKELANYLGVSLPTLSRWVKEKKIDYIKLGENNSAVRFAPDQIEKFINAHRKENTDK